MSRSANNLPKNLSSLSKKTKIRKAVPLLNMSLQLREINDRINVNMDFEKPQFIDFFGSLFAEYILQRLNFVTPEGHAFNNILSVNDKDNFSLDKINRLKALSPRQLEIFEQLLKGLNNFEISRVLNIKESTVKNHLNEVYLKLGVPNRYVTIAQYRDLYEKVRKTSSET
jgi:DNA-binding CsgD family transcriptional regulator